MKKKHTLLKIIAVFTAFSLGAGLLIHHNVTPTKVEAAQHMDNFANYTYSGTYYNGISFDTGYGMNGELRQSLTNKILPTYWYTYSGSGTDTLSEILQEADEDPTNSNNMIYLYTRDSVTKNAASSWNREHVWPQSLSSDVADTKNWGTSYAGADLLHIRPTYESTNSSRSNDKYCDVNKTEPRTMKSNGMLFGYGSGDQFEPLDAVKGDVARIIMYIWTAYTGFSHYSYPFSITSVFESYDTLLKWHTQDKPDVLEGNRNDFCESSKQGNRNPFVDHPELAWKIFGDQASTSIKNACMAAYPGDGSSTPPDPQDETVTLNFSLAEYATTNNVSSATKVNTIAADDVVTLQAVGSDSNTGMIYIGSEYTEWRFYKSGSGTLKITVPDGVTLVSAKGQIGTSNYGVPSEVTFSIENNNVEYNPGVNFNVKSLQIVYRLPASSSDPTGISLDKSTLSINVAEESQLTATLTPVGATAIISWSSNNTTVATVANGTVRGVSAGTTTITASAGSLSASCTVTVTAIPEPTVETKTLAQFIAGSNTKTKAYYVTAQIEAFKTGSTKDKYGNMTLTDGTNSLVIYGATMTQSALAWNNANAYVFTNPQDFMTNTTSNSLSIGDVITMKLIRCDYTNNGTTTIEGQGVITAIGIPATAISLDKNTAEIDVGGSVTLTPTLTPSNATSLISWLSSNTAVATVDNGVVNGISAGTATITAKVSDSIAAQCVVTVNESIVVPDATTLTVASSIAIGDIVYLAANSAGCQLSEISTTSTKYGIGAEFTSTPDESLFALEVVAGKTSGTFAFKLKAENKYLMWSSGNSLATKSVVDENSSWTVSIDGYGNATIANSATSSRVIWWNVSSPRFACYESKSDGDSYKYTQLWKSITPYLNSTSFVKTLAAAKNEGAISGVSISLGATISQEIWEAIDADWPITAYGVMTARRTSSTSKTVIQAYKNNITVADKRIQVSETPDFDNGELKFTAKINVSNYNTLFGVAPYIVAGGQIFFLEELDYSVKELAQEYLDAEDYSVLSRDILLVLAA